MNTMHHDEMTDADYLYICALLQWGAARLVQNGEDEQNDCIRAMEKFAFKLGSSIRRPR